MESTDEGAGRIEREIPEAYLQLSAAQRKFIHEVIRTFTKAKGWLIGPLKIERTLEAFPEFFNIACLSIEGLSSN